MENFTNATRHPVDTAHDFFHRQPVLLPREPKIFKRAGSFSVGEQKSRHQLPSYAYPSEECQHARSDAPAGR